MTYFAIFFSTRKFQANLEVSEVLITYVTNRGKARVMLQIGTGHSNNCQIMLKLFGYHMFCNNLQHKKFQANFEVSKVLITYVINRGKARVMLHIGAGHSNNCQIICKFFVYDIFCNNLQEKKFMQILRYQRYKSLTNRGKAWVMLHIGASHSNNCQIILE